jgi:hypothetical protein
MRCHQRGGNPASGKVVTLALVSLYSSKPQMCMHLVHPSTLPFTGTTFPMLSHPAVLTNCKLLTHLPSKRTHSTLSTLVTPAPLPKTFPCSNPA